MAWFLNVKVKKKGQARNPSLFPSIPREVLYDLWPISYTLLKPCAFSPTLVHIH